MLKQKFDVAKAFIEDKQYSEARTILKTIDHPTADKWLAKLDEIAPEEVVVEKGASLLGKISKKYWVIAGVALLVVVGVFVYSLFRGSDTRSSELTVYDAAFYYCQELELDTEDTCHIRSNRRVNDEYSVALISHCIHYYENKSTEFDECLFDAEVNILLNAVRINLTEKDEEE